MHTGSCIIFTAVLSVIVLKRRLNWLHCTGALADKCLLSLQTMHAQWPSFMDYSGRFAT